MYLQYFMNISETFLSAGYFFGEEQWFIIAIFQRILN